MGAVQVLQIPNPAFYGQAKDRSEFPLGPEWAVEADNIVIDSTGRIAARKGWDKTNDATIDSGADVEQMFSYVNASGTEVVILATETKLFRNTVTLSNLTGALTPAAGNWKFVNYNGYVLGWQSGETPIAYNGEGSFADISAASGTLPDGNAVCAAFGRVWAVDDDQQTIRYSALLDHTRWATAHGGGSIDMRSVWTQGMDRVVAIEAFGSNLVVFGSRHIILWSDGSGSQLGLNPTTMYVTDTIDNIGLVGRDALALVGEIDIVFWSNSGIRSLVRTMQERASPVNEVSPMNRNYIATALAGATTTAIRGVYAPQEGLVLFLVPGASTVFVFDVRQPLPDGGFRMTEWQFTPHPTSVVNTQSNALYFGFAGNIGQYTGYLDDTSTYEFRLESGWVDIKGESGRKQALKALKAFLYAEADQTVNIQWGVDFGRLTASVSRGVGEDITVAEWGLGLWGVAEWGAAGQVEQVRVPLKKEAEYFRLRVTTTINGSTFSLQPLTLYTKPMRLA